MHSIELINPAPGQPTFQAIANCFTAEAKRKGVSATVVGQPGQNMDNAANLEYVQQAVADGVNGLVVETASDAVSIEPALEAARSKGVIVATMESGNATAAATFDVGIDIVQYAKDVAAEIASLPGQHNVAILTIALSGTPKIFDDTFAQAIAATPNVKLVDTVIDNGDVTKDADLTDNILTAHPEANVIVTVNPGSTAGVVTAINEHSDLGKVSLVGLSLTDAAKSALQSGAAAAVYVQRICDVGTLAVDNLIAAAAGQSVPKDVAIKATFATKSNYTTFDSSQWN